LFKDFSGAYSNGSVQDLHLIPFSVNLRRNGNLTTKIKNKGNDNIEKRRSIWKIADWIFLCSRFSKSISNAWKARRQKCI